jgi:hypothetical protein
MEKKEEYLMFKPKIKVGHYYELKLKEDYKIQFAVLYGFERGKNKDIFTVMMFTATDKFEFPIEEGQFDKWVNEGKIKEITSDEILALT